jgi:glycosyltransferase involved in cell wall biosynthesis
MKILDVSPRVASLPQQGSAVRMYNLLRQLSRRHDVRQFSQVRWQNLRHQRAPREIRISPSYLEYRYADRAASLLCEVSERAWVRAPILAGAALSLRRPRALRELLCWADVTLVEFPWQFGFCHRLRPRGPLVLAAHNVEALKFPEYAPAAGIAVRRDLWIRSVERAEAGAVARADLILAVSPADRLGFIERYGADPARVVVVPNGADTQAYRPTDPDARRAAKRELGLPERPMVLFAGANVPPNWDGVGWVRRLASRSERFTFVVVGRAAPPGREANLLAVGAVPEMAPWLRAADFSVCPIRFGGGTKIKLLESMAAGLPTVVFAESIHGLDAKPGEQVLVVGRSETELLAALDLLADDPARARRIGCEAAAFVARHHDWSRIAEGLEAHLLQLVGVRCGRTGTE